MSDKLKKANLLRQTESNRLTEIHQLAAAAETDATQLDIFKIACLDIDKIANTFSTLHNTIIGLIDDNAFDAQDAIRMQFETMLLKTRVLKHKYNLNAPPPTDASATAKSTSHYKVPKISLPTFSGDITTFKSFIGLFNSMIHQVPDYTPTEKFNYLLSSLEGYALSLVQHLPITDANYIIAYDTITSRYQGNRPILKAHWDAMAKFRRVDSTKSSDIRELLDCFKKNRQAIEKFELPEPLDLADYMLFNMLLTKLDSTLTMSFEMEHKSDAIPKYSDLFGFLEKQWIGLSSITSPQKSEKRTERKYNYKPVAFHVSAQPNPRTSNSTCSCCDGSHTIYKCPTFNEKTPNARFDIVKTKGLCINCLSKHNLKNCRSTSKCFYCKKMHHSLLHFDASPASASTASSANSPSPSAVENKTNEVQTFASMSNTEVLLSTAIVYLYDSTGNCQRARALLDSASQASFLTLDCFKRTNLMQSAGCTRIQCLGNASVKTLGSVVCKIASTHNDTAFDVNALIVDTISNSIPASRVDVTEYHHLRNLHLADPEFNIPSKIDLILGADVFPHVLLGSIQHSPVSRMQPSAIHTAFGWIVMGNTSAKRASKIKQFHCSFSSENSLENTLKSFWHIETFPHRELLSEDETRCDEIYAETVTRDSQGRYTVDLPFRPAHPPLKDSRHSAYRQFLALETRLLKNPQLYDKYKIFMQDYIDTSHMSRISSANVYAPSTSANYYYIPHHGVLQNGKLRVVFNASCQTANGPSLNDILLPGRKLHNDLFTMLLRFRVHTYVFTTDIKQMFRQILVKPAHRSFQRIVWRFAPNMPLEEFELNTVTYGIVSSPYHANRTIIQLCNDQRDTCPKACKILEDDIYVDDIATGADSIDDALEIQREVIELMQHGGFALSKWAANNQLLLRDIPDEHRQQHCYQIEDKQSDHFVKILGLQWLPSADCFSFRIMSSSDSCTKRIVLSEIARVFDPIGFLAPVTFFAKHLIQYLWTLGLDWDEPVPSDVCDRWISYKEQLPLLQDIQIHRALCPEKNFTSCELIGFADSSERGYAAVVYLRFAYTARRAHVALVTAKTKVAPLKRISIPKLELCAAVLLSDLLAQVKRTYNSQVVLTWIKSSPHRWQTFVSNRISHIQDQVAPTSWFHVASSENPADPASRGLMPSDLVDHPLWWAGPAWLLESHEMWPIESNVLDIPMPESKEFSFATVVQTSQIDNLLNRFSSLVKIQRIIAYCRRFMSRAGSRNLGEVFTREELLNALHALVKVVQTQCFAEDKQCILAQRLVCKPLRKLNPFVDEKGLLRVGGRLVNSQISYDKKFPILLPSDHRLTQLIIEDCHRKHLHIGLNSLHFLLLQNFWILTPKKAIRRCLSQCYRCFRARPQMLQPKMGNLPAFRVTQLKAFRCVGVDYAGPFSVTLGKHRGVKSQKAYICLFVCASTKALHLELASSLSMEAFIAAFHRFIARRGLPIRMFSDCGTNFVAARKEIDSLFEQSAAESKIEWSLNPPSGPHFGGLFESGVKSVKTHLARVIGTQILTYEEFYTVLVQVEAVLNSRPLTPISSDPCDLSVLTPGHFLSLEPLTALPEHDLSTENMNRLNRWQLLHRLHQDFWKRWHAEYLHTLQQRSKWHNDNPNLNVGMLVLIAQDNASPLVWRIGRIEEVHLGADGVCRVVTLRTTSGIMKRPVVKLSLLPGQ